MINGLFSDILRLLQILLIPAVYLLYKYLKKQIIIGRDIADMKTYILEICKVLKITCTLKDV